MVSNPSEAEKTLKNSLGDSVKKGFLRDRIAKRKEAEQKEFGIGDEDDLVKSVDEFTVLTSDEGVGEFSLYRESYVLTVTEELSKAEPKTLKTDSFDVTQMTNAQFESFAEVSLIISSDS